MPGPAPFHYRRLPLSVSAGVVLIAVAAFIAYLPCITGEFVLDDDLLLTNNPLVMAPDGLHRLWCTARSTRLLAGDQYHLLDRVAAVGNEFDRLSRQQSDLAHRRGIADLDHLAKVIHSRGIFGSH